MFGVVSHQVSSVVINVMGVLCNYLGPYFVILGSSLLFDDTCWALLQHWGWHIWVFTQFHPYSPIFTLFHPFFAHFCRMISF